MSQSSDPCPIGTCACRAGLACGIVWGAFCGLLGVTTLFTMTYGHQVVEVLGNIYWGFAPGSAVGALAGLLWGFVDGLIAGFLVVAIYRALSRRGRCCCRGGTTAEDAAAGGDGA